MRIRVVGWEVRPITMADDGENLTPVNVQAVMIPAAEWQSFKDGGDRAALQSIGDRINSQPE